MKTRDPGRGKEVRIFLSLSHQYFVNFQLLLQKMTFVDCGRIQDTKFLIIILSIHKLIHIFLVLVSFRRTVYRFVEQTIFHFLLLVYIFGMLSQRQLKLSALQFVEICLFGIEDVLNFSSLINLIEYQVRKVEQVKK